MSGLNQRFTKPPAGYTAREFESHILRKNKIPKKGIYFTERGSNRKAVGDSREIKKPKITPAIRGARPNKILFLAM